MNKKYTSKALVAVAFSFLGTVAFGQTITGTVFDDRDANGQKAATEPGVAGVVVTAFRPDGSAVSPSATSAANGTYSLTGLVAATKYRIEFTNFPATYFSTPIGTSSASSVQFATAGATNLNFGVAYPRDFCDSNPDLVVPCYSSGDNLGSALAGEKVLVRVPYSASNTSPMPVGLANAPQIGSTFGTSIHRLNKKIFTTAFLKRHAGLGPGGLGAIYVTDPVTMTSQTWAKLQDLGQDVGVAALGARPLPNSLTVSSVDAAAFDLVGKAGLGSLTISSDEKTLYTINLFTRQLLKINVGYPMKAAGTLTSGDIQSFSIPSASAAGGVLRPFAVKFQKGKVYVGAVATAETSGAAADLRAYVFEFDDATNAFNPTPVLTITNMAYPKGDVHSSYPAVDKWMSWTSQWSGMQIMGSSSAGDRAARPQPMFTDLGFTDEGDMVLGFCDRGGHQTGYKQKSIVSGDTKVYNGYIGGDLLRAKWSGGAWTLESNGTLAGGQTGCGKGNNQGPGGGEFYCADNFAGDNNNDGIKEEIHQETFMGGMVIVPGTNQIVATVMDPINIWTGGFTWFSNTDGNSNRRYQIYQSTQPGSGATAGKANGLGVTDAICAPPPLEIGNRVWKDLDGDGLQDPNEPPLVGVTVKLFAADGTTVLATATTDAAGNYSFSSGKGTASAARIYAVAGLVPETNYFVKITALGTDPSVSGVTLASLSPGNAPGLNAGTSLGNNDGYLASGVPAIQLRTGETGDNNHTYDFGFSSCVLNVTAASNSPVCPGGTINLTSSGASGAATYAWSGPNAFVSTAQNPSINSMNSSKSGTYQVIVTDGGCRDTAMVTVSLAPFSASATGGTACEGSAFSLKADASSAATFSWTGPSGFSSSDQNPSLSPVAAAMAGAYSVTATAAGGCSATASATLVVNSITPTAGAASATVCPGGTINLTATGGATYAWTGPSGFVSNDQNPAISNVTNSQSGSYVVTVTAANGCTGTASTTVTVSSPTASAGSNSAVCAGAAINLTASAGTAWSWTGPNGFSSSVQNPTIAAASTADNGIFSVTVTMAGGCTATASTTVVVHSVAAFAEGGTTCTGGSVQLKSAGGTSYAWSGPSGFSSSSQNPTVAPAVAGIYTVTVSGGGGCSSIAQAPITVVGAPTASASLAALCEGGALQLFASGGATSYAWTGPNGYTSSQQNPVISNATALHSGLFEVQITGSGCSGSPSVNVTVDAKPTVSISATSPVCEGATITLEASGGSDYAWSGPNGFVSASPNPAIAGASEAHEGSYSVTVTSAAGCSATASAAVVVNAAMASATTSTPSVCEGSAINLMASAGAAWAWEGPNGFSDADQNPIISSAMATASGIYSVTITSSNGCTAKATSAVEVKKLNASAFSNGPVCEGSVLQLSGPDGMASYAWTGPSGFSSSLQNPKINYALPANAGTYTLRVADANGCTATATASVAVLAPPNPTAAKAVLCVGETITLNTNGAVSPTWTLPNGTTSGAAPLTITGATAANSGTYVLKNADGCTATFDIIVTEGEACMRNYAEVVSSGTPDPTNHYSNNSSTEDDDAAAKLCFSDCQKPTFSMAQTQAACTGGTPGQTFLNITSVANGTKLGFSQGALPYSGPDFAAATAITGAAASLAFDNPAMATTFSIRIFNGSDCCFKDTFFVIQPSPCATATNAGPVCQNNAVQLSATGGGTYAWTGPGGFSSALQNPMVAPAVAGAYDVVVTLGAFTSTASTTVEVFSLPTVTASSNSPVPTGNPIQLSATSNPTFTGYAWSGPNGFESNAQQPVVTSSAAAAGAYTVTVTSDHGCTATAQTTVAAPSPTPCSVTGAIGGPTERCEGDTLFLMASGGAFYSWAGPNGWTSIAQNPTITDIAPIHSGQYSVTVTGAAGGCTDSKSLDLLVNARPKPAPAANDTTLCAGQLLQLSAAGSGAFAWTGPNGFSSAIQNPSIANVSTAAAGWYFVQIISTVGGCRGRDSLQIFVNESPVLTATNPTICAGKSVDLTALVAGYAAFSGPIWRKGAANGPAEPTPTAVLPTATTSYFLIVSNPAGCADTLEIVVTVNALPTATATATPASASVCAGQNLTLNSTGGGTYAWTGPNGFVSTAQNPTITAASESAEGFYTVKVTSAAGCEDTARIFATINETIAAASGSPTCAGGTIVLAASGGTSYAWTGPNSFTSTAQNPMISNADFSKMGVYSVVVTGAGGCTSAASVNIIVTPVGAAATSNAPICEGGTLELFATNGGSAYAWTGPGGFSSTLQNPIIPNATASESGTYNVVVTGTGGCTGAASVAVSINSLPTPNASSDSPACVGETVLLTATGGENYSWTGPDGFTSAAQNPVLLNVSTAKAGTYTVVASSLAGCTATATTAVAVNAAAVTASAADATVCAGAAINLMASAGGSSYAWTGPDGFASTVQNPTISPATAEKAGIYTVQLTSAAGCTATATATVLVQKATASATVAPVCEGGDLAFFGGPAGMASYAWTGPSGFSSSLQNPKILAADVSKAGTYTLVVTDAEGCTASATATAIVNNVPTATAAASAVCVGGTIQLQSSGGAFDWQWSGPNGFFSSLQNPTISNVTASLSGTYNVTVTGVGSCAGAASVAVTVNPVPTPSIAGGPVFCENSAMILTASGGSSYAWTGPGGFVGFGSTATIPAAKAANAGTYFLTATDANGCTATVSEPFSVNVPTATATATSPLCTGMTATLTASSGDSYAWTGPDGFASGAQNPTVGPLTLAKAGAYTVIIEDADGCTATATTILDVKRVSGEVSASAKCADDPIFLYSSGTPGAAFSWTGPNGFSSALQNPVIAAATAADFGTFSVTMSKDGCSATYSVAISQPVSCLGFDFGDLPDLTAAAAMDDYQTQKAFFGAGHRIVAGLRIGSAVDAEATGQPNLAATGDGADEDGITLPAFMPGAVGTVAVTATNTTGAAATLFGFIDWNNDGDFGDAGETASVAVPNGSSGAAFSMPFSVPAGAVTGADLGVRFRLSSDPLASNAIGTANSGEVEDYRVNMSSCPPPTCLPVKVVKL